MSEVRYLRAIAVCGVAVGLLTGCVSKYDRIYFAKHEDFPDIPECVYDEPPHITWPEEFAWRQKVAVKCTAEILRRRILRALPADASLQRVQAWLEDDGFRCTRPTDDPGAVTCTLEGRARVPGSLLPAVSVWRQVWRIAMHDVIAVPQTITVTLEDVEGSEKELTQRK